MYPASRTPIAWGREKEVEKEDWKLVGATQQEVD